MKIFASCVCQFVVAGASFGAESAYVVPEGMPPAEVALRQAIFARNDWNGEIAGPELDLLFWANTQYLLSEPSHSVALKGLDEFIAAHGESSLREPWRRALLQRDLWQLFDWTLVANYRENGQADPGADLRSRIATVMRRLALSAKEIAALPDSLESITGSFGIADFPRGLPQGTGNWVMVGTEDAGAAAAQHQLDFSGRSAFLVMLRLPGGRPATLAYLKTLQFDFPENTVWALVRVMNVLDADGNIRPTHFVESIQMRRYPVVGQDLFEAHLDRAHAPRLRVLQPSDQEFGNVLFFTPGWDLIQAARQPGGSISGDPEELRHAPLRSCMQCHNGGGLASVRSFNRLFGRTPPISLPTTFDRESAHSGLWKQEQANWRELSRLWKEAR